jgi:hypothetical protein
MLSFIALAAVADQSYAVGAKPVAKHAPAKQVQTKGTQQMAGGQGAFGTTYTLTDGDWGPINFTIKSVEYSVARVCMSPTEMYAPKANEKLIVIHYRIKNPNSSDFYYSGRSLFQTVDTNNTTLDDCADSRRESETQPISISIKPGQGIDDLVTYAVVTGKGAIPKLILKLGKPGSSDRVTRFALGTGPNIVAPIPAPYADPADPSGATALTNIKASIGTTYVAGYFDTSLDSAVLAPGPFGDTAADDGKRFLVAKITVTNKSLGQIYVGDIFAGTVITSDDDKITDHVVLKAKRDEAWEGRQIDPGESVSLRLLYQVPSVATIKTLGLVENEDNSGSVSHELDYDLSSLK